MFKIQALLLGLLLAIGVGIGIFPCRQKDYDLYEELLKSSNPSAQESLISCSQQTREGVQKQIWYQDEKPLHIRINSGQSELCFFHRENQIAVVEHLEDVVCIMQEELYYVGKQPMQRVRYLEAEKASYNYNSHLFVAEDVTLWKYQLEGHSPPAMIENCEPLMRATAQSVEFTLKGEKLDFIAHQMRAVVSSGEKL